GVPIGADWDPTKLIFYLYVSHLRGAGMESRSDADSHRFDARPNRRQCSRGAENAVGQAGTAPTQATLLFASTAPAGRLRQTKALGTGDYLNAIPPLVSRIVSRSPALSDPR